MDPISQRITLGAAGVVSTPLPQGNVYATGAVTNPVGMGASHDMTLPVTPAAGNIIVVQLVYNPATMTTAGYTQIGTTLTTGGYLNNTYYRVCNGTESATLTFSGGDGIAVIYDGTDKTTVSVGSWATTSTANLTITPPTATTLGDVAILTVVDRARSATITAPTGYTKVGPGQSSSYFSVNGFYDTTASNASATVVRSSAANSFTGIGFRLS